MSIYEVLKMRAPALLSIFLIFLTLPNRAVAQNVHPDNTSYGPMIRKAGTVADNQGFVAWPNLLIGETGTQVHVTFDLDNADVTLITGLDFGSSKVLTEAQKIAVTSGYPKADFLTGSGKKTTAVDIELNKYLNRGGEHRTEFTLKLGRVAAALQASNLPKPIVLFIDGDDADSARFSGPTARVLVTSMFLKLQDVQPGTELLFSAMLPAYIFPVAYGTIGLFAALVLAVFVAPTWMALRPKGPYPANVTARELLDPAVVQTNYNRQRPLLLSARFLPIVPFLLVPFLANHQAVRNLAMAMSEIVNLKSAAPTTPLLIMPFGGLFLAVSYGCAWIAKRTLRRRDNAPADSPSVDSKGAKDAELPQMGYLRIITGGMVVFPLIFLIPAVRNLDSTQRILLVGLLLGTVYITAAIVGLRSAKRVRKDLVAGDPMYDLVMEMAERANVSVRHVVVTDSRSANAYASIFGTVGLTSRLLENFDTDEIRAIVAHELGHLRALHVHKTFLTGLAMVGGYFVLVFAVLPYIRIGHNPSVELLLRTPAPAMLFSSLFVPLLTGKTMRRREQEADRFAVALTGDPDLVIRTLRKIHTINQTPHMLKPSDEVLASHPSLAHRIDAIRSQCEASVTK